MNKFSLEDIELTTTRADNGDTNVGGTAYVVHSVRQKISTSKRLTATQQRGGLTLRSVQEDVAGKLAALAFRKANPE